MGQTEHPFERRPHHTMVAMSAPVLISLIAEPLTGLIDTAFVRSLGAVSMAALGIGVSILSITAWIFNFLSIGTQTEVARAAGADDVERGRQLSSLAMVLSLAAGTGLSIVISLGMDPIVEWMADDPALRGDAATYLGIRLLGSPWMLVAMTAFGALRGLQDMRTPLLVVTATHAINITLDPILIFGWGSIPAMGLAGAAWASTIAQWIGTILAVLAVGKKLGWSGAMRASDARRLCVTGADLFARTGLLTLFLLLSQRAASRAGTDLGAAHQAVRQTWIFTAFALDAFAASAQSLVGYYLGAGRITMARQAAAVATKWALSTGVVLGLVMASCAGVAAIALVPETAHAIFWVPWFIAAASQPLNALSFVTDGIHWGTADYRYLRNAMIAATVIGLGGLWLFVDTSEDALIPIWIVTTAWIAVRAGLGCGRIWPGSATAPLGRATAH